MADKGGSVPGKLVVISGPSGAGKSTVCSRLAEDTRVEMSVSATTRPPRRGEVNGQHYQFLSREQFEQGIRQGEFAEHAEVFGHLYGTPRQPLEHALRRGKVYLLDIDVQGAMQVMEQYPQGTYIFLEPPGYEELSERLDGRGTESEDQKATRLKAAASEMALRHRYTHRVVNDDLDRTIEELRRIVFANTCLPTTEPE